MPIEVTPPKNGTEPVQALAIPNQVFTIEGQVVGGFSVVIENDEEFAGTYHFTDAYTYESAVELIFSGDAFDPYETTGVNT